MDEKRGRGNGSGSGHMEVAISRMAEMREVMVMNSSTLRWELAKVTREQCVQPLI